MDIAKLFVAFGISMLLMVFFNNTLSTIYKSPKADYSKCYSNLGSSFDRTSSCTEILKSSCGENYFSNYSCYSNALASQEYKVCTSSQQNESAKCMEDARSGLVNYQIVYYLILAFISVILIVIGILFIEKVSLGAGFIGGGILIILFASLFAAISSLVSSFSSLSSSIMTGSSNGGSTQINILSYINIFFILVVLVILILFSILKLEKVEKSENQFFDAQKKATQTNQASFQVQG